jgi:hypothetical protein
MATERTNPAGVPSEELLRLIDAGAEGMSAELRANGARLLSATAARSARIRSRRHGPRILFATGAAALVVGAVVSLMLVSRARSPAAIAYEVESARVGPRSVIAATDGDAHVRFSEGSEMDVARGATVSVRELDSHGAHIALGSGRISLDVMHLPAAQWFVEAGPFEIAVTGTSFTAEWSEAEQQLQVTMKRGSVEVTGPLSDGPIALRSGQRLIARARERETIIREPTESDVGLPAAAAASAVASAVASSTGAPPVDSQPPAIPSPGASAVSPSSSAEPDWASKLSSGHSAWIVEQVEQRGADRCLRDATSSGLAAIADAARFERRFALARKALLAQRQRFRASARARDAAFLLGRVEEADGNPAAALDWYATYSREGASGTYESEALGREMSLSARLFGAERALPLAREYLTRFPDGSYAMAARSLLASPSH